LVAALLLVALQSKPSVLGSVDRKAVAVGDVVTFTVRVDAVGNEAVEIMDPPLDGLLVIARGMRRR